MKIAKSLLNFLLKSRKSIWSNLDYSIIVPDEIYNVRHADFVLIQDIFGYQILTVNDYLNAAKFNHDEEITYFLEKLHLAIEDGIINIPNPNHIDISIPSINGNIIHSKLTVLKEENNFVIHDRSTNLVTIWDGKTPGHIQKILNPHLHEIRNSDF